MKKNLLILLTLVSAASIAGATVITNETFSYSDGDLTTVSGGVWVPHSGIGNQLIQVVSGRASFGVVTGSAEDANMSMGTTNTTGDLYASFVFNFSTLPTATEYFAHFKDNSTGYRCRIFSTTTGAGVDKFRVGIRDGSSGTITFIVKDLDLATDYKLVARFRGSTNSTIWINPSSESSGVDRADSVDIPSNTFNGSQAFALRQASGMGTLTLDDLIIGTAFTDVQTVGGAPSISGLVDVHIPANTNTGAMPFLVSDVETPAGSLNVAATSDNPTLVPNNPANLTFGGADENRTLTVTPAAGQEGLATIEAVVTDGDSFKATNSFSVYVGEPTISAIANQATATNTVLGPVAFSVNDGETSPGSLTVTPSSSDEAVIPSANIIVANLGGTNRTVTITPAADTVGVATITLTVGDGTWNIPTSFVVTVYPKLGLLINEPFTYPDGLLAGNGGWIAHSGVDSNDCLVLNSNLVLSFTQYQDVSLGMPSPYFYFPTTSGVILYKSFKVNFSALPGSGNEYFSHYRDTSTFNYRARVAATTSGAATGYYRIGIVNAAFTYSSVPRDLKTNATYLVITRYNVSTGESAVWVNPVSEALDAALATDAPSPVDIWYTSFRQNSGIGTLTVDDLKVGTEWSDVWEVTAPVSEPLRYSYPGGVLTLTWTNTLFSLQASSNVNSGYTNVLGATSPYPVPLSEAQKFYRLKY